MNQAKVHLLFLALEKGKLYQTFCKLYFTDRKAVTQDSTEVTCKNCLKAYLANQAQREESDERS